MNITLIGMPGVGKSIVGKELARKLAFTFLDTDVIIEKNAHLPLHQIIDIYGESVFLEMEQKAVLDLGEVDNHVICPGGSVIYSPEAMAFLQQHSVIIFLDASLSGIEGRIGNLSARGVVGAKEKRLKTIYKERIPFYHKYAARVITMPDNFDVDQTVGAIIDALSRN